MSLNIFRKRLVASGLLSEEDLHSFLNDLPVEEHPTEAAGLANTLIRSGKLTEYQAKQLMHGKTKSLVFGNYVVFDKIGEGGMGVVLKARHRRMDRVVAVKVLAEKALKSPDAVERFYREVKAAARLSHPNVVTAYDADEHQGTHYFAMEYVEGQDLSHLAHRRGPLPVPETIDYIIQAARGLQYAHSQGVVHRDIKPGNLLLDTSGTVKILDMGLARFEQAVENDAADRLTHSGQAMGTAGYMAPEQAEDTHSADQRADIYSLGCSLHRLLTNKAMYSGDTLVQVLLAHRDQPIPSLRDERPDVPEQLDAVYQKMVAKRPEDRYQSMTEVITALEHCLQTVPAGAKAAPAAASEPTEKSDSNLRTFLDQFSPGGETIRHQADMETGATPHPPATPKHKSQPWWLYATIGAGVVLAIILGLAFMQTGDQDQLAHDATISETEEASAEPAPQQHEPEPSPDETPVEQPQQPAAIPPEPPAEPAPEPTAEMTVDEPIEQAPPEPEMQPDESEEPQPPAPEPAKPEPTEPEPTPPPAEPQPPQVDPAEIARRELLEKQRAREAQYTAAMKPVEDKVATWDFVGAWEAAKSIKFNDEKLSARLAARQDEIRRMGLLKRQIIAKIAAANPPLKKSDLKIRGIGGEITDVGLAGITTKTIKDEVERLTWNDLGTQATGKLVQLVVDTSNGEDCVAAGLLSFTSGDHKAAQRFFDHAKEAGVDVSPQLAAMAASTFAQANQLVLENEFEKAAKLLEHLQSTYADLPWLTANKDAFDALLTTANQGVRENEAEALYTQAVKLHEEKALFDLRDAVTQLKTDYAACRILSDTTRKPSFPDLEQAVADVGRKLTVRLKGKADHNSIQAAIDAAPPNSLIEIADNGPYNESIIVPKEKHGLTIRGTEKCFPRIAMIGQPSEVQAMNLIEINAPSVTLERVVVIYTNDSPKLNPRCLTVTAEKFQFVSSSLVMPRSNEAFWIGATECHLRNSVLMAAVLAEYGGAKPKGIFQATNCLFVSRRNHFKRPALIRSCTHYTTERVGLNDTGESGLDLCGNNHDGGTRMVDSIVGNVYATKPPVIEYSAALRFGGVVRPGSNCIVADPLYRDPKNLDFRLMPNSPCIGRASDGGDMGVRYTPEMIELCRIALELRAKGVIKF